MAARPLTLAAVGVAMAALDLRVVAWDLAPDALGWGLVALAAHRLTMRASAVLAALAAVASLAELQLPYLYEALDPLTGEVVPNPGPNTAYDERLAFPPFGGLRMVLLVAAVALGGAALTLMLVELRRRASATGDLVAAGRLRLLSWAVPLGWAIPTVGLSIARAMADGELDPVWNEHWEIPALIGIAVALAVVAVFATNANRRWSASGDEIGSPWADLMLRGAEPPAAP